jgi:hypothetical protein
MKKAGHQFDSATRTQRRAADGGARCGGGGGSGETEEEEGLGGPVLGRKAVVTVLEFPTKNRGGLPWPLGRIERLNRRACRNCFQIYFKDFDSSQRVLNIFKPNLN